MTAERSIQMVGSSRAEIKPSKCEFFRDSLRYLGHVISRKAIATDNKKIETNLNWPRPKTITDVRSLQALQIITASILRIM